MNKKEFLELIRKKHLTVSDIATNNTYYKYYIKFKNREEIIATLRKNEDDKNVR